jgi:transposase InsO family protein
MRALLLALFSTLRCTLQSRAVLHLEILALRHQIGILRRSTPHPKLKPSDRIFWVLLSRMWSGWRTALAVVKPQTVIRWHRRGFRLYWRRKSRARWKPGRPGLTPEVRDLIRQMSAANPLWGAPRIHGELLKLGIDVSQTTVARYMVRSRKPPSQTWRTFLDNHVPQLASLDFFIVPTATFRLLYVLVILSHDRRRVVHFNVTSHPTAEWTYQQIVQAFPWDSAPRFLIRDRDACYGRQLRNQLKCLGIEEVLTAAHSPWQNSFIERLIGSIRRECLDYIVIFGEEHLRHVLRSYFSYYHASRTHLSLDKDAPQPRPIQPPSSGHIVAVPQVGGLHHRYERRIA